jgi:hypothetical protein
VPSFTIGTISDYLNGKVLALIFLQFVMVVSVLGYSVYKDSSEQCVACHGNREKLNSLGYPQFFVTQEMVEKESNHPNVKCHECHLGDGRARDAKESHKGMLKAMILGESGDILERMKITKGLLLPHGTDRINELLPPDHEVRNILWHDRNPETFNFDPAIAEKTCGKSNCHPQELEQFRKSVMATNFRQRTMKTWIDPDYGPHNCGPSFADIPSLHYLEDAGFDFRNYEEIRKNLNVPFTREQAIMKQKFCNVCHAGCLDCHYVPSHEKGVHSFVKKPVSESCAGNGRGTSICHPGAMQSRRGETYIGGDYSIPTGMKPDVHYKKNIHCVDCHLTGEKGMGDMQRKASCQDCHIEIEEAHQKGIHKKLDCATCHISELGGYQITIWGPGYVGYKKNPFEKYSLYYGIQKPPILMKNQKGIWMPVKIWPHSVGNIKYDVKPSEKILFRWPNGETKDAYFIVGTFDSPEANSKHLLWIQIEQAAHPFGKSRSCGSCHESESQLSLSHWEYYDYYGSKPFEGDHRISADATGLRIEGIRNTTPMELIKDAKLEDFATWLFLGDKWIAPGDFSFKTDKEKYKKSLQISQNVEKGLKEIEAEAGGFDKKTKRRFSDLKGVVLHNPDETMQLIADFRNERLIKK